MNDETKAAVGQLREAITFDRERVLDLITAAECLQAAHHFLPLSLREAISRGDVDACRAYAKRTDEFMASLQQDAAEARTLNAQLAAQVDDARRQRDECAARITEFERLQQVWLMSPEAAQRLQGYRDLAGKCAALEAELAELRKAEALADELRTLRARVAELEAMRAEHRKIAIDNVNAAYAEAARMQQIARTAEAQVAEAHERLDEFGMRRDGTTATLVEGIAAMRERIDEYRAEWYTAEAQVAAARAECARLVDRPWSRWAGDAGRDVLRAMDEAAKK